MSIKSIVVGGGTGFIGTHLTTLLQTSGYNVISVSRMPGVKRMTWHELTKKGLPKNTVAAINVAGQNVLDPTQRWSEGFQQNVWNSRINTTTTFVQAIAQAEEKPEVFINISGVSGYQPSNDKVYTEDDPGSNYDYMSNLCVHWEEAANLKQSDSVRLVKIRTGVVIGRNGGMIKSLRIPFWLGLGGVVGSGEQILPWIHLDDLCNLIKFSIENRDVKGVLNGVAPDIITNASFTKAFSAALGRPAIFPTPAFIIKTIFGKERAALLLDGAKIQPKRTLQTGFQYKYPKIADACREVC